MTKKFWTDWQKRIGETTAIYGWCKWTRHDGVEMKREGGSLIGYLPFKILFAKFNGDTVDLKLEIISEVAFSNCHHVKNKYYTLHRNDISTIRFRQVLKNISWN